MDDWKKWAVLGGGVLAIVGQFWGMQYYLSAVGGVLVLVGTLVPN